MGKSRKVRRTTGGIVTLTEMPELFLGANETLGTIKLSSQFDFWDHAVSDISRWIWTDLSTLSLSFRFGPPVPNQKNILQRVGSAFMSFFQAKDCSVPDPLSQYLGEIQERSLLSAAEEHTLADAISRGDRDARARMIQANLRLVVAIAREYQGR